MGTERVDPIIKLVYKCYLGKTKGQRLEAIVRLIRRHNGKKDFFDKYSTSTDSIMEFLKKVEAKGIEL